MSPEPDGGPVGPLEVVGRRRKSQPAPPPVLFEALTRPDRPGARAWMALADTEVRPVVLESSPSSRVVYSSFWPDHPADRIEVLLTRDSAGGDLEWRLWSDTPADHPTVRDRCRRLQELFNRDLRESFGQ